MRKEDIERVATGHWPQTLRELGVDEQYLSGKHGPCPMCGGADRYRFTDYESRGGYICNQCGAGDGYGLLMKTNDWNFRECIDALAEYFNVTPTNDQPRRSDPRKALQSTLRGCSNDRAPLVEYLAERGLECCPPTLRLHPSLTYWNENRDKVGDYPAMLAVVHNADDSAQSVHRTYLNPSLPVRKKMMSPVTALKGAAIRLFPADRVMAVAEGIETAIAVHEMWDVPVWSLLNANLMEQWSPPEGVDRVLVCADHDDNFAGQRAAYILANRLVTKHQLNAEVHLPEVQGTDWLDVWTMEKGNV